MIRHGFLIVGAIASGEDPSENFRMEGLHATAHHLWKLGVLRNIEHLDPGLLEMTASSAGAVDFDALLCEPGGKVHDTEFVTDADECAFDRRRFHELIAMAKEFGKAKIVPNGSLSSRVQ